VKVVHLVPAMEQGGVESVVCDLNGVLVRAGWESVVISKGGRLVERIESSGGRHVACDLKSKNPLTYVSRVLKLRRLLRAEKPDLVCVHSRVPAWLYVGVRKLESLARTIGRSNNQTIKHSSPAWITYAHGANSVSRYSEVMTKGDLVVTPSRFLADYLKENYGTAEEKLRVVPNAVDMERFNPNRLDEAFVAEMRREWGIADGDHVMMAVGRITKVKGLESLIRDFAESCRFGVSSASEKGGAIPSDAEGTPRLRGNKLVIVGGADRHHLKYLESLKSLAASLNLNFPAQPPSVVFAGPQAKIPECLSIADEVVSANTTKPETFGLSIVEAYAMNKPVRAKRFGGAAEVMSAVEQAGTPTLREAVQSLYGLDRFVERTLRVYREALDLV